MTTAWKETVSLGELQSERIVYLNAIPSVLEVLDTYGLSWVHKQLRIRDVDIDLDSNTIVVSIAAYCAKPGEDVFTFTINMTKVDDEED